ncbi:MAG: hypothetical protein ACRDJI_10215 [Actinomycetota bacterium]
MRKTIITALVLGLLAGSLVAPADAKKKKKKPKAPSLVQVDQQMFLRGDGCTVEARALSTEDNADTECIYTRAGLLYDTIPESAPAPAGANPWQTWPAVDGIPLKLDATKPLTGEIYVKGTFPLVGDYPGISAGNVKVTVKVVGESGGEEKTLGEFVDEFTAKPGDPAHATMVSITLDPALNGLDFTSLTLHTRIGGASVGHGVYQLNNPSSFIKVPTLVTP